MRSAGVESFPRMQNATAKGRVDANGLGGAAEGIHPAYARVPRDRSATSDFEERRAIDGCPVVAKVRRRESRRMLRASVDAITRVRRERVVGPVDLRRQRDWRKPLVLAQRFEGRPVAHSVIDAEVDVARVDLA